MFSRALLVAGLCAVFSDSALAESVTVKYRGPVPLDTFQCAAVGRSSFIERVCYDAAQGVHGHSAFGHLLSLLRDWAEHGGRAIERGIHEPLLQPQYMGQRIRWAV
jgi:hypothetical protein